MRNHHVPPSSAYTFEFGPSPALRSDAISRSTPPCASAASSKGPVPPPLGSNPEW